MAERAGQQAPWARVAAVAMLLVVAGCVAARGQEPSLDAARALHLEGRLSEALAAYEAFIASPGADAPSVATASNNACVLLADRGRFPEAVERCQRAVELRRGLDDPRRLARGLNNLGRALQGAGKPRLARGAYEEALELNRSLADDEGVAFNLTNLATLAIALGDYDDAFGLQRRVAELLADHPEAGWRQQLELANGVNRGATLEKLGAYEEALEVYRELLEAHPDGPSLVTLRTNLAVIYRNLGDPVRAVEELSESLEPYRRVGDLGGLSNAHLNLGLVQGLNLGDLAAAEHHTREALRIAREAGDRVEELQDLCFLGRLLTRAGDLPAAEETLQQCLELSRAAGSKEGAWSALGGLGRAARAAGDLARAWSFASQAIEVVEDVRSGLESRHRDLFFADKRTAFELAVAVAMELEARRPKRTWVRRGLETAQQAKARDLLDTLGGGGAGAAVSDEQTSGDAGQAALLEYFVAEGRLYAWRVEHKAVEAFDLGPYAEVADAVAGVYGALAAGDDPPAAGLDLLSRRLLESPLAGALPEALRIAPDLALRRLPFEILTAPGGPLADVTISYLPSGAVPQAAGTAQPAARTFLGLGAPAGGGRAADLYTKRFGLAKLPEVEEELLSARRALGGKGEVRTGAEASESAFLALASEGASVIHLATHAVLDERSSRGPAVLLAPDAGSDGLLYPDEVAGARIRSRLTVLAACRTAVSDPGDGRALTTLAGAFLAGGSEAVVASLWDVGDQATAAFMEQFYWQLARGRAPAAALRLAKARLRAEPRWSKPSLWAAFIVVGGRNQAVVPRSSDGLLRALILAAVAALLASLVWAARRRAARPTRIRSSPS